MQLKLNGRVQREAHNIFRSGYSEGNHAKFRRVLTTWMLGRSRHLVGLARFYRSFFEEELPIRARFMDVRRNFLTEFFAKEPALGRKYSVRFGKWRRVIGSAQGPRDSRILAVNDAMKALQRDFA